jgi:FkbM family methyltransferase
MKTIAQRARTALRGRRPYLVIRRAYHLFFNSPEYHRIKALRAFYRSFVSRGDLVFDIGANIGEHTEVLIALGATVVAVEPNPECAEALFALEKHSSVHTEVAAIGACEGAGDLHIARWSGLSTLSQERIAQTTAQSYEQHCWTGVVRVQVTTIDTLAARYGLPVFVKIDTEGFEERALAGMSFRPRALSFEFHAADLTMTARCVAHLPEYEFNYLLCEEPVLRLNKWVGSQEIMTELHAVTPDRGDYGDVIARLRKDG